MRDIVLVTVDSLRADHVGWQGYDRETTPNLAQRADRARLYRSAFAHACSTRPSFPNILTSSYALSHGGFERLSADRTHLAAALSREGYRTAGLHSNLYLSADFGYDRGFDSFDDSREDPSLAARARNAVKRRLDSDRALYGALQRAFNATERRTGVEIGSAYIDAADLTDLALDWVRETADAGPRFLWVHYMDVHHPYVPPRAFQRRFRETPVSDRDAIQLRRKMLESPGDVSTAERETLIDLYDAEIAYVDEEVDRLLTGVSDAWGGDPIVAFTADHGEAFGEHGGFSHSATFYDEVLHVPLLVDDGTSESCDDLVGHHDLAPTLLDCADRPVPSDFLGTSLVAADREPRDAVIAEWADTDPDVDATRFAIRSEDWKYVQFEDGTERLFDLASDPAEQHDVVDAESDVAADFRDRLREHRERIAATNTDLGDVTMDEDVAERLRLLGYQE